MSNLVLRVKKLHSRAPLPTRAYGDSAGYDLAAFLMSESGRANTTMVSSNSVKPIPTRIALAPPPNHLLLVCSRSGLATKGVFVANGPGVVDPSYTGEIIVLLFNGTPEPYYVKHGDRIAQILIVPFLNAPLIDIGDIELPARGARGPKGFGSTGA